jgi:8-oxo-dGTP pyrophosphatase MutT (NUDIX family)
MTAWVERLLPGVRGTDALVPRPGDTEGLRAAVATIVRPGATPAGEEILFIKRADRAGDPWSGHMAFPGGRRQADDSSLLDTAVRETLEEIGLDLGAAARPIGRLPDLMPHSQMPQPLTVTAFLFSLEHPAELSLNHEVAAAVWAPLERILRGEGSTTFHWSKGDIALDLPAIAVGDDVVWGLTYRMIEMLREALTPR